MDNEKVEVPKAWLKRLVELANELSTYDNSSAAQVQGYIQSANEFFDLGVKEDE